MGIRGISEHHQRDIFCQLRFLCFEIWRCECKTEREREREMICVSRDVATKKKKEK